jgi:hypothetical protein
MIEPCGFCGKIPDQIDHANQDLFDIYLCVGCIKPDFDTRFRMVCYKGYPNILAITFRIDEYYVVVNYAFNYTTRRTRYTTIYKKVLGNIDSSLDLEPITWDPDLPVCDLDMALELPLHNPTLLKEKLKTYTIFS